MGSWPAARGASGRTQANEYKERYDKIGPGPDGREAVTNPANLMSLANPAMRAAACS